MPEGIVYVLKNQVMPKIVKIGRTTNLEGKRHPATLVATAS